MSHHDRQHTGRSPYAGPDLPALKWRYPEGDTDFPVIGADGTIYSGYWDHLNAIQPNGAPKWQFQIGGSSTTSAALGADGTVYVGSSLGLYAIQPNGIVKWHYPVEVKTSPTIGEDGTVYIGSWDHRLYALHSNGSLKWWYTTADAANGSPAIGIDGTIYVACGSQLEAISPNGSFKWRYLVAGGVCSEPAIAADGTIYVVSCSMYDRAWLYAIDPSGSQKWRYKDPLFRPSVPALAGDGTIYVGAGQSLYAVRTDGSLKWRSYSPDCSLSSSPAIGSDGTVYAGDLCHLAAIGADGVVKWTIGTGTTQSPRPVYPTASPAIGADGTIYIGSYDGCLYAIGPRQGGSSSISGRVRDGSGNGISGVTISDGAGHSAPTDASGHYTLSGLTAGTYTLTPSKSGYTFSPASRTVTVPPDATGRDFVGTLVTYAISGRASDGSGNPLSGVSISDGAGHTATTDGSGNYTLSGLAVGTYTVTPSKSGYTFSPASRTVSVPPSATGRDFVGTPVTYSISGNVRDDSGNPMAAVAISDGAGHRATTDGSGSYTLSGLVAGTYFLTPSKGGYVFLPASSTVSVPPDASGQDFVGTPSLYSAYLLLILTPRNPSFQALQPIARVRNTGSVACDFTLAFQLIQRGGTVDTRTVTLRLVVGEQTDQLADFGFRSTGRYRVLVRVSAAGKTLAMQGLDTLVGDPNAWRIIFDYADDLKDAANAELDDMGDLSSGAMADAITSIGLAAIDSYVADKFADLAAPVQDAGGIPRSTSAQATAHPRGIGVPEDHSRSAGEGPDAGGA